MDPAAWPGQGMSGSSSEARREPLDAMTQLSQGRVEAIGVVGWYRVGDRPVHRRQRAEFLTGPVAHRDDEVAVLLYPADMPRLLVSLLGAANRDPAQHPDP